MDYSFKYDSCNRSEWIYNTIRYRNSIVLSKSPNEVINICFGRNVEKKRFAPMHIVLLSCLIDELKNNNYKVRLVIEDESTKDFLWNDVKVKQYWNGKKIAQVQSPTPSKFNLWRILEEYKDQYAINICQYFKTIDNSIDFSGLQIALNELYYNIFDHADAKGNAFSYISFEGDSIIVAVCDFGKGISHTIRNAHPEFSNDVIALENAMKNGITSRSKSYNAGHGLYNIATMLGNDDYLRILSNKSFLACIGNSKKIFSLEPEFEGTLIYLKISMSSFPQKEIVNSFDFD